MVGMNPPHSPYRSLNDCEEQDFNLYKDQPLDSLLIRPNVDLKMKSGVCTLLFRFRYRSRPCFRTDFDDIERIGIGQEYSRNLCFRSW